MPVATDIDNLEPQKCSEILRTSQLCGEDLQNSKGEGQTGITRRLDPRLLSSLHPERVKSTITPEQSAQQISRGACAICEFIVITFFICQNKRGLIASTTARPSGLLRACYEDPVFDMPVINLQRQGTVLHRTHCESLIITLWPPNMVISQKSRTFLQQQLQ